MTPHSYTRAKKVKCYDEILMELLYEDKKKYPGTYKSSTGVTERWAFVRSFMEVMCVIEDVA